MFPEWKWQVWILEAAKLDGVNKVSVNAMTYKLTLDSTDETFDVNLQKVVKLFADIEPDCEVLL